MSIYRPPEGERVVHITSWSVREVGIKEIEESTRHLCGLVYQDGRVCSPIQEFNPENMVFTTRSGKHYCVVGSPGSSMDSEYVWNRWCSINGVDSFTDVTNEYLANPNT